MAQTTFTPFSNTETAAFCSQMAMVLRSGISSMEGISLMLEDTDKEEERLILMQVDETLRRTGSLHQALEEAGVFPSYMLQMVSIGEQTGKLDDVMSSLADYYDRQAAVRQMIKSAITYPLIMICMMLLVILVLITRVMPIFNQVFQQLGSEMNGLSRGILQLGTAINRYSVVLVVILVVLALLGLYFAKSKNGRKQIHGILSHIGWFHRLYDLMAACQFASGMSLTLSSGMTPEESIELTSGLIQDETYQKKIHDCSERLNDGEELSHSLLKSNIFTGIYARMVSIGSKTGSLDEIMRNIAQRYQEEIDQRLTGIIATLEPSLVIILSLIVGMILLSVMLPLMGIMAGL